MIIVWLVAAVSGVSLFVALLPFGWILALIGASLGSSALAALAAVGLAWRRGHFQDGARPPARAPLAGGIGPRADREGLTIDHPGSVPKGQLPS